MIAPDPTPFASMPGGSRRVAIVQSLITDYRVPFFQGLHRVLAERGVELTVFAGAVDRRTGFLDGLHQLPFGVPTRTMRVSGKVYYQPLLGVLAGFDLAIVEQANGALLNYPLLIARRLFGRPGKVAYWGHGATFQRQHAGAFRALVKRVLARTVDHWFAYTEASLAPLAAANVDAERISVVNNSVDLSEILRVRESMTGAERSVLRRSAGLGDGPVAVFCSRLYAGKRLNFLVAAADQIRDSLPNFELLVIGDGPEMAFMRAAAATRPWLHLAGALYGSEKARALVAADVMMLPAWVGLSILDGFAAGLPCLSAAFDDHSPEIAYLLTGENGVMTPAQIDAYAAAIVDLFNDPQGLAKMRRGAILAAERHSLAAMVRRFSDGVFEVIGLDPPTDKPRSPVH